MLVLLTIAIVALAAVLFMLLNGGSDTVTARKVADMEERIQSLQERLDKYTSIDEKVTRIWEQAKSFEKFKDRFDRSEASMSLRMDHLTLSLENLQKQIKENPPPKPSASAEAAPTKPSQSTAGKIQYHEVTTGDTLYSISKKYSMSVAQLRKLNHMDPNRVIVPGQKLIVHGE
ncbi:MAG: LysM domain-containing protein [Desulfosarcinaceae bacterium]